MLRGEIYFSPGEPCSCSGEKVSALRRDTGYSGEESSTSNYDIPAGENLVRRATVWYTWGKDGVGLYIVLGSRHCAVVFLGVQDVELWVIVDN